MGDESSESCWHCIIIEHSDVGAGKSKYTQYRAQSTMPNEQPQELVFRFSQVDMLAKALARVPDLSDIRMPSMPPKVTFRTMMRGRFDPQFLEQRQELMQGFFDSLGEKLNAKYSAVGNVLDLCEPLGEFVRAAAASNGNADADESRAAIDAVQRAIQIEEDREIIASQEREYEESLQRDELRRIEEAEKAEKQREEEARKEQERLEEERKHEIALAEAERERIAKQDDIVRRREAFEAAHGTLPEGVPLAMLRFRAPSGATVSRKFPDTMLVATLFEFAAVAEWNGPAAGSTFDLRTSMPTRSLRSLKKQTLKEAELTPSATLMVAVDESFICEDEDE